MSSSDLHNHLHAETFDAQRSSHDMKVSSKGKITATKEILKRWLEVTQYSLKRKWIFDIAETSPLTKSSFNIQLELLQTPWNCNKNNLLSFSPFWVYFNFFFCFFGWKSYLFSPNVIYLLRHQALNENPADCCYIYIVCTKLLRSYVLLKHFMFFHQYLSTVINLKYLFPFYPWTGETLKRWARRKSFSVL